ncbi:HTH domain-containing protein [Mucisphaera calidilacus]|uniref:HTH HARE-type domain-containing protein n=1 Tax=Mucisphaera calidilacus TaxID=2527982 RepID=A0A518BVU7_9BACT|nr:winged helix-turn-helix domain-containing protein [Mucisphaera calidilacus]QDU71054.1 hypothetical protein Pan265_08990 [Mucisphaera calidilacus]
MKKIDVQIGATYLVKVAGNLVPVKIEREHASGYGWEGVSQKTGKTIRIKSPQRLRQRLGDVPATADGPARTTAKAKTRTQRDTGQRAATGGASGGDCGGTSGGAGGDSGGEKQMSLLDAAAHLLSLGTGDDPRAMRCQELVDLAIESRLWSPGKGKTPANTLYAAISREIKVKGDASRFVKAERGKFALASTA